MRLLNLGLQKYLSMRYLSFSYRLTLSQNFITLENYKLISNKLHFLLGIWYGNLIVFDCDLSLNRRVQDLYVINLETATVAFVPYERLEEDLRDGPFYNYFLFKGT